MGRSLQQPIELVARCIDDPVTRLRFLKAAAPTPPATGDGTRRGVLHYLLLAIVPIALVAAFLVVRAAARVRTPDAPKAPPTLPRAPVSPAALPQVWMVERNADEEVYSNGLRVDTRFAVSNHARDYLAFPRDGPAVGRGLRRSRPAGIVFHTTESLQVPFEPEQNGALKSVSESLLEYVRRRRAYHYLIDRFGRVFRVVAEEDAANHAGYSVWADDRWLYLSLNESFLGVAFETRSGAEEGGARLSPAQVRSAAVLTEFLRDRYGISPENCITHVQVSVNPGNMRAGYHTDWASGFPFEQVGLPDNYSLALPSAAVFGFVCDAALRRSAAPTLITAIERSDASLEQHAAASGMSVSAYRKTLQRQYRALLAQVKLRDDGRAGAGKPVRPEPSAH